jgi:hypothetical protein
MKSTDIELETMSKLFEYEKHSRVIDKLDFAELKEFAKLYCKLYLRQQEVISSLDLNL